MAYHYKAVSGTGTKPAFDNLISLNRFRLGRSQSEIKENLIFPIVSTPRQRIYDMK